VARHLRFSIGIGTIIGRDREEGEQAMASFVQRMIGSAKLQSATYEDVENDRGATAQAMAVVVLSSIAAGLGIAGTGSDVALGVIAALIAWMIWALVTWFIGTKILPGPDTRSNWGELLRTIGFASSPGILRAFGALGAVGRAIAAVASIWMLIAMVIAVRQALDYKGTGRAIAVCVLGFLAQTAAFVGIYLLLGGTLADFAPPMDPAG
jgi:hypothetical protein